MLSRLLALSAAAGALLVPSDATRAQLLITGNDEKVSFDENTGKTITPPGGQGHGVDHRHRRPYQAEDRR